MRKMMPAVMLIGALAAAPAFAAQATTAKPAQKPASGAAAAADKTKAAPSHSTSGKVKSVDASSLVVTKGGKDMTFVLDSSTQKEGAVEVGADVTVRYHADGKQNMATAVMAKPAKPAAAKK